GSTSLRRRSGCCWRRSSSSDVSGCATSPAPSCTTPVRGSASSAARPRLERHSRQTGKLQQGVRHRSDTPSIACRAIRRNPRNETATMTHYDVIIIGTGAGGGTLAYHLAPSGKRILLIERGDYVRREKDNWNSRAVNVEARYHTKEVWRDRDGRAL